MLKPNGHSKGRSDTSESITFRMGKPILDELRQEAEQKMESINTLVNQIVKLYIDWHKPAKQSGYGYFDKALISEMINLLSEEQIIQLAEQYCKRRLKDIIFMLISETTFASFMDGILLRIEASGFNYKYSNNNSGDFSTLVIHFDMGKNWSLFFKTYMQSVLEYYKITDWECEMADNTVVIKIKN